MEHWKTLSRRTVLDRGKWLVVEDHTVELPNGRIIDQWPWLIKPDYVNVLATTEEGKFICFRQTKYAIEGTSLAPVGGYLEPGEEPLAAARRELLEETGYASDDWIHLGRFRVDPNRGSGYGNLFLACGVRWIAERNADDLEEQELLLLSRAEIETALVANEFKVLAWAANVALALNYLK